ncbi:MAG: hypothetical protein GAK31_01806 [Stenotrophomonas maltophilia]|uniref:Uncharacterized protein n=1 Tax=Stenotrophomonas maltophilia TaxID=40324 RepID=A0A7V8JMP8_STEMA|nr:MAG: hypothetical protein GAK31_01806 [Stenotrophomonas maltophilia]
MSCEGCTLQQMQDAARGEVDVGGVAVYSLSTGEIRSFVITNRIQEIPVSPQIEDYFIALVRFWNQNGRSLEMHFDLASATWNFESGGMARSAMAHARVARASASPEKPLPSSAYEAIQSPARMNNMLDLIGASMNSKGYLAYNTFINSVKTPIFTVDAGQPVEVIHFADGSLLKATYNLNVKGWESIPGTGRDIHNNPIPEKREDVVKDNRPMVYEFPGDIGSPAYMDFSQQAFYLGINISFKSGDRQVICTSNAFDEDIRVEVIYMSRY